MRYRMGKSLLSAARHEAAHALVCMRLGGNVRWVQVHERPKNGGVHGDDHGGERGVTCFGSLRKLGPVRFACVAMAGSVAEHLWHGTPKGVIGGGDFEQLQAMGVQGEDIRIIWEETSRLLRQLKPRVWKLAEQLRRTPGKRIKPAPYMTGRP